MTLTNPQKAILHVAASKLEWDDDTYRMVLVRIAGVTTSTDLDQAGFEAVMGFAEYCGFRPLAKGAPRYGNRPGMATFAQIELIREIWRELHDQSACNDEALTGWLLKFHKVSSMRFLTLDAARKEITALTFAQIVADVADTFPPNRRTSMSALSRWWKVKRAAET